ncbi:MAG: DUF523 and DUF1722 domain-containing protein [Desulfobacterales bacterium]|jgi:uncharacterized protein YbgA (DUF1722 family)/uncharacterized protein YbbK (DUF523 family)|nr:DUF523 and DUF1722 domain-containing protein [Desulfobacterales bacterium]
MDQAIRIGISACLLGEKVRYDGGHKKDRFLTDTLGQYVTYVPVCPEVECGLGVPRETMRLVGDIEAPRLVTTQSGIDHTAQMVTWARQRAQALESENLCGFIFKSDSPSSGMERVKVYGKSGMPVKKGVGVFARIFMAHFPFLPAEEEGRLHDPALRENFIERVFVFKRWRELLSGQKKRGELVAFHTHHKLMILAHSPAHYKEMGKLIAKIKVIPAETLYDTYQSLLMAALQLKATPAKNTNVLQHVLGYFKKQLTGDEKQELLDIISLYQKRHVPLIVPVTLINHYVQKYNQPYLKSQFFLSPHPIELNLRNHA